MDTKLVTYTVKVSDSLDIWNIYLNQLSAAIRSNVNESTRFSPFYLLYSHDPVLPIDIILKPRRTYLREPLKIGLEQQHKSFIMVHQHLKKAKRRQARYADKTVSKQNFRYVTLSILNNNSTEVSYKVGYIHIIE